jgi:hypothetical protein
VAKRKKEPQARPMSSEAIERILNRGLNEKIKGKRILAALNGDPFKLHNDRYPEVTGPTLQKGFRAHRKPTW